MEEANDDTPKRDNSRINLISAVLAILAAAGTLGFAWSGFQSGQWVRQRFFESDASAALAREALDGAAEADRLEERDTILYVEWIVAKSAGDDGAAATVFEIFRPPIQDYVIENSSSGGRPPVIPPFSSSQYDVSEMRTESRVTEASANRSKVQSDDASRNAARYGALSVMFAAALAGVTIANRFAVPKLQWGLTIVAGIVLTSAIVLMIASPILLKGG